MVIENVRLYLLCNVLRLFKYCFTSFQVIYANFDLADRFRAISASELPPSLSMLFLPLPK